nr:venom polypeptide precursor [Doratifera vulnerans]
MSKLLVLLLVFGLLAQICLVQSAECIGAGRRCKAGDVCCPRTMCSETSNTCVLTFITPRMG